MDLNAPPEQSLLPIPSALAPLVAEIRVLRSAWGIIAPLGVRMATEGLAESARELSDDLAACVEKGRNPDAASLAEWTSRLATLSTSIREISERIPTSELRTSLPDSVGRDRRGVLDLLDLLIEERADEAKPLQDRMGSIDYLVTLLCTGGSGHMIRHDPVTLSTSLNAFCLQCEGETTDDGRISEVEAEFFAAATMDREQLEQELAVRQMRMRKAELGLLYFTPRVLRAVVTYNAVLIERMADRVWDSTDWGEGVPASPGASDARPASNSVFKSPVLQDLAESLRRRRAGDAPLANDTDRIAWCLDLDYANEMEQNALLAENTGTSENVLGTTILVGLVNRSLDVLSVELQLIGIDPNHAVDDWVRELAELMQKETDSFLAKQQYKQACALSELKNKFLLEPLVEPLKAADVLSARDRVRAENEESEEPPAESLRDIMRDALGVGSSGEGETRKGGSASGRDTLNALFGGTRVKEIGAALFLVGFVGFVALQVFGGRLLDPDLDRLSGADLERVSVHLSSGYRNGEGAGPAFVGTVAESWNPLALTDRDREAAQIVEALQATGIHRVMLFDSQDKLRLQAIGSQPIQSR